MCSEMLLFFPCQDKKCRARVITTADGPTEPDFIETQGEHNHALEVKAAKPLLYRVVIKPKED
jgi:hypothetical protein